MSERDSIRCYHEIYDFTSYLLRTYSGTGKVFFLGNWEADWHLFWDYDRTKPANPKTIEGMTRWFRVRQQAIEAAKRDTPHHDVTIFYYIEVNLSDLAVKGKDCVINNILPEVNPDYVSFSSYKTTDYPLTEAVMDANTNIDIVSDKLNDISAQLEMNVCDFSGKVLQTRTLPVTVKANAVTTVLTEPTAKFTDNIDGTYLSFSLKSKDKTLSEQTYFFTQPKNLQLTKPTISSKVEKKGEEWEISLKSNVLAKNIYLNFAGIEGFFSDNYFDVLPGKEYKVIFTPKDKSLLPAKLELMSLVDSYN